MKNNTTTTPTLRPLDDTDITTWELPNGAIARFGQGLRIDVEFSHDAAYLSVATKIGFWLYDTETLAPRALWGTDRGMMNVATFSHDSRWIATGDQDGILKVWDTQNGQCVAKTDWGGTERRNVILHVHFSPDDQYLAASGFGHSAIYAWRGEHILPISSFKIENTKRNDYRKEGVSYDRYFPIAFSPNSNIFAYVSSPETVTLSDIKNGKDITQLTGHTAPLHTLLFSPCGQYLASGSWWRKTDKVSIRLWEVATGENIHTFWGHTSDVQNLAFSKDGTILASSSYDGTILLWDMKPIICT